MTSLLEQAVRWLEACHSRTTHAGVRHVVILAGEPAVSREATAAFMSRRTGEMRWVGASAPPPIRGLSGRRLTQLLGDECDVLALDLHASPSVNTLAAAMGLVRAGGLLLLPAPEPRQWPRKLHLDAARLLSHGQSLSGFGGRLPGRLARIMSRDAAVSVLDMAGPLPAVPRVASAVVPEAVMPPCRSPDQAAAVTAVKRVARGHPRRPLVLTADRGRGKSAALGIAAAQLMADHGTDIVVTGPGRTAVAVVFQHARAGSGDARQGRDSLRVGQGRLRYIPVSDLLRKPAAADLVMVDEAATLPVSTLEKLLEQASRVVFSTTVHGYEGSGQGFALRFGEVLQQRRPQWRALHLRQPVRWAPDDPVEPLFFRALLMDAAPAPDDAVRDAGVERVTVRVLDREALAADESLLREVYGLLVQAHYQTRPSDLYQLLDAPGLQLLMLDYRGHAVAVGAVTLEGGFDRTLAAAVHAGTRRPRGHLLAQLLEAHAGVVQASRLRQARVQRIAVHPALMRRGLGRLLLRAILREAARQGCDLAGASFGAEPGVLAFWRAAGFHRAWLGARPDPASGSHAAVVVRPLSAAGRALVRRSRARFRRGLPRQLGDLHRGLAPRVALAMLANLQPGACSRIDPVDREEARHFAATRAPLAGVLPTLQDVALALLSDHPDTVPLRPWQRELLLRRLLQGQEDRVICQALGLAGRRELDRCLREAFAGAVSHFSDSVDNAEPA